MRPKDELIDASQFSEAERQLYEKIRRQEMLDLGEGEDNSDYDSEDDDFEEVDKYGVKRVKPAKPKKDKVVA